MRLLLIVGVACLALAMMAVIIALRPQAESSPPLPLTTSSTETDASPPPAAQDPYLLGLEDAARGDWRAAREHYLVAQAAGDPRAAARIAQCDRCLASQTARTAAQQRPPSSRGQPSLGASYTGGQPARDGMRSAGRGAAVERGASRQPPTGAASSIAGECPRGGAHEPGRVDASGRLHCRKCGRFM